METLGLYVHIPFCTTKCGYCDFYSVASEGRDTGRLTASLLRELAVRRGELDIGPTTVFFGGGTPTLLPGEELESLLASLAEVIRPDRLTEFTVEANPATLDEQMAHLLLSAGVDRVSFGAQSFDPAELAVLERIHDPEDIGQAVRIARSAGFGRLNLDLIFGIPGQTLESWRANLARAIELRPDHLSCYGLTYEPGTALTARRDRGLITTCDDGLEAEMYLACIDTLNAAGFEQYEISNFARPGQACRHNVNTWRNEPYVGIGPSAASYIGGERRRNVPHLENYVRMIERTGRASVECERLDGRARAGECAMLALRLTVGFSIGEFRERTGCDALELFGELIERFQGLGLLAPFDPGDPRDERRIKLTRQGLLMADSVMSEFLSPVMAESEA